MSHHMKNVHLALVAVLGAMPLAGLACSSGAVATCEEAVKLQCEFSFRCCTTEERLDTGGFFQLGSGNYTNSESECIERSVGFCRAQLAATDDAIALGRVGFDGELASKCLDGLREVRDSCDQGADDASDDDCQEIFEGLVGDGDKCASSQECKGGGTCLFDDPPDVDEELGALEGECAVPPGNGDPCPDGVCGENLQCNANQECEPLPGEGDPCNFSCDDGLFCNGDGVCQTLLDDGEACSFDEECASDLCEGDVCTGADNDTCNGL